MRMLYDERKIRVSFSVFVHGRAQQHTCAVDSVDSLTLAIGTTGGAQATSSSCSKYSGISSATQFVSFVDSFPITIILSGFT